MQKVENGIFKDCFGGKHLVDDDIWDNIQYVGRVVSYDLGTTVGFLCGIFYDDEDVYYEIERVDGKKEYCSCVGELEVIR